MTRETATRDAVPRHTASRKRATRDHAARDLGARVSAGPLSLALVGILLLVGCSGAPQPKSGTRGDRGGTLPAAVPGSSASPSGRVPEPAVEETASEASQPAPEIAPTPAPTHPPKPRGPEATGAPEATGRAADRPTPRAKDDKTLIIIDQREAPRTTSLAEAAQKAREDREKAPRPKIVITDDNLAEYATGELTVAAPETTASAEGDSSADAAGEDLGRNEEHWRRGVRELRLKLRRAWDEARILEEQVAGLRLRFYAEDDPHVRDSEIKPAWDRALERQRQTEEEVQAYRRELDRFLEEGRRAGALPGWLREGIEYEPELEDEETGDEEAVEGFGRLEPVEPERMDHPSRPPG